MAVTTTQLNTRIDPELKERGDKVFSRYGLTPSSVVRAVWAYASEHGDVPDFMRPEGTDAAEQRRQEELERKRTLFYSGSELALRYAQEQGVRLQALPLDVTELRNEMYDDMEDEYERRMRSPHA